MAGSDVTKLPEGRNLPLEFPNRPINPFRTSYSDAYKNGNNPFKKYYRMVDISKLAQRVVVNVPAWIMQKLRYGSTDKSAST